jgi:hypothetical protein
MAAEEKIVRRLVRTVREGTLVHCYLECGHLITMHSQDLKNSPSLIECWACEAARKEAIKNGFPPGR